VALVGLCCPLVLGARHDEAAAQPGPPPGASDRAPAAGVAPKGHLLDATVTRAVEQLEKRVAQIKGRFGVAVVEVQSGRALITKNAGEALNPASNMKIVTAWAALRRLGPAHRFHTGLYGRLEGARVERLVIKGDGDPSLEMPHLWEMLVELRRAGLRAVGDIVVDQSAFDREHVPPAFEQQPNEWASFRAPVAAVSLAGNTVAFEIRPQEVGAAARITVSPASFVVLSGQIRTSEASDPEAVRIALAPEGQRLAARLGGTLPANAGTLRLWRRVDDPTLLAGHALKDLCAAMGIDVGGEVKSGERGTLGLLAGHRSPPLSVLLGELGKSSNNFYAEMVFKALSASSGQASFERSAKLVADDLAAAGIEERALRIGNGSGLFDANRLTTRALAELLAEAQRDPRVGPELVAQLAIAGVDGTLRQRLRAWGTSRAIRAKTGTLAGAIALSGYVLAPAGQSTLAFSVMVAGPRGSPVALRPDVDRLVDALAKSLWNRDQTP
jgi:D-alanyl-D-alanine carboxypeptidase/D-alanyl-D-alanine-endopeptidase (penicillin-binding protein 4)